ncbi:hypothetical protein PLACP1_30290 [Planifilum fimeticola]
MTQTVEQKGANFTLTIVADKEWLTDPKRKYPVTIDPTIIIQPTPTESQDAMILSGADADSNFDTSWRLSVGTTSTYVARSLVKFNLSGIEKGTQLDAARVELYYDQDFDATMSNPPRHGGHGSAPRHPRLERLRGDLESGPGGRSLVQTRWRLQIGSGIQRSDRGQ